MSTFLKYLITFLVLVAISLLPSCQTVTPTPSPTGEPVIPDTPSPTNTPVIPEHWSTLGNVEISNAGYVNGVGFTSPTIGMLVGRSNRYDVTADGGVNWTVSEQVTNQSKRCRFGVDVVDTQVMAHCGPGRSVADGSIVNTVEISSDGGKTWKISEYPVPANSPAHYMFCSSLSFIDSQNGWAAAIHHIVATRDGGDHWSDVPLPQEAGLFGTVNPIIMVSLLSPGVGYLMDLQLNLYATSDSGQTWTKLALPLKGDEAIVGNYRAKTAIRFTDAQHGEVAVSLQNKAEERIILLLTTEDGGASWERETIPVLVAELLSISHDGSLLTIADGFRAVTLLKYTD